jgi:hypothetical protein
MAREDGKHLGPATKGQGKGTGTGGMTDLQDELVGENTVLSNRDKAQHSRDRGQDTKGSNRAARRSRQQQRTRLARL